jgi:hypothetical protein
MDTNTSTRGKGMNTNRNDVADIWYSKEPISEDEAHYPVYCLHCWDGIPFPLYLLGQNPAWLKTHPQGPFGAYCPVQGCSGAGFGFDLYEWPWWLGDQNIENLERQMEASQNRERYELAYSTLSWKGKG